MQQNTFTRFVLLLLSIIFTQPVFAQEIIQDSKGKDILEVYTAGAVQSTFTPTQTALKVNYNLPIKGSMCQVRCAEK